VLPGGLRGGSALTAWPVAQSAWRADRDRDPGGPGRGRPV